MDLSSLALLDLSAAGSHGAADLHCGRYNVSSLCSSILTADCRGNVQRRGGKTLVSAEFEHRHTNTHPQTQWCCRGLLGAISLLAILLMLASLMVVNAFS